MPSWRCFYKVYDRKLIFLILCIGFTIFVLDIKKLFQTSFVTQSDVLRILAQVPEEKPTFNLRDINGDSRSDDPKGLELDKISDKNNKEVIDNCPMVDFFTIIDVTAKENNPEIICTNVDAPLDLVCLIYLKQIELDHLSGQICKLNNPKRVPKIVYFVIFEGFTFKFCNYIAMAAAKRFIKPTAIYLIGDQQPRGIWWQKVLQDIKGVRFVYRTTPITISGQIVRFVQHRSDVVRLQTLYMNGGIYLDIDMIVVRDLEPLLDYDITLGMLDNATGMGNAFIAAKRHSPFIQEWYSRYTSYNNTEYYWNSLQVARNMWFKNPSRVHMESSRLYRPNWFEAELMFNRTDFPWRDNNYAMHVWVHNNKVPQSPDDIQTSNMTIAQVFRYAMYGDWRPRA